MKLIQRLPTPTPHSGEIAVYPNFKVDGQNIAFYFAGWCGRYSRTPGLFKLLKGICLFKSGLKAWIVSQGFVCYRQRLYHWLSSTPRASPKRFEQLKSQLFPKHVEQRNTEHSWQAGWLESCPKWLPRMEYSRSPTVKITPQPLYSLQLFEELLFIYSFLFV